MNLTQTQQTQLHSNLARLQAGTAAAAPETFQAHARAQGLWNYLQTCEAELILFMGNQQPDVPQHEIEWGLVLYLLNDPNLLSSEERFFLHNILRMPPSNITPAMLTSWESILQTSGVVCADGTFVAEAKWAILDPGWILSLTSYLVHRFIPGEIHHFPTTPATFALDSSRPVTLGLVSDWGTGPWQDGNTTGPAEAVIAQLKHLDPDVFLHLGDTYYAGLASEETNGLVTPLGPWSKPAFTLNSNHEMYDGANGYFKTALAAPAFQHQGGTSYFALTHGSTVVIGLDSAYFDRSELYMAGALTDPYQIAFLKSLDLASKTVILLTHHNPLDITGTLPNPLWSAVTAALGRQPDLWYWGHLHNGIAYTPGTPVTGPTRARCIGFGALPFGRASLLYQPDGSYIPSVQFSADTPVPNPAPTQIHRLLNGFATLTLHPDGTLEERFFDQTGTLAWQA